MIHNDSRESPDDGYRIPNHILTQSDRKLNIAMNCDRLQHPEEDCHSLGDLEGRKKCII